MLRSVTTLFSAAVCTIGLMATTPAQASDHGRYGHDLYYDLRGHHHDHRGWRDDWHDHGRRYAVAHPYWRHRCNDRRHHHHVHFHVPVRYYYRDAYVGYTYRGVYGSGPSATVILSFPL